MMKTIFPYFIAIFSGAIGLFAFSPFDYWWIAYLSAFGLIYVTKTASKKTALKASFLWGISFFSIGTSWLHVSIHQFGGVPIWLSYILVVVLAAYLSLYPLLFTYLVQRFQVQSAVIFAIIWTISEFLRGWVFTGFPWLQLGYSQIDSPFAGIAPIFGVTGLNFFVIWLSAMIVNLVLSIKQANIKLVMTNLSIAIVLIITATLAPINYVKSTPERGLTISLAQGNIEQSLKWDPEYLNSTLQIYSQQIKEHLAKSDLIILPESAFPILENHIQPYFESLKQASQQSQTEIMIGTLYQNPKDQLLNSLVLINKDYQPQQAQRYNKHHLVPFGEYVPLESLLRPLGAIFNLPMSSLQSGDAVQPALISKNHVFTPAICYEIIEGEQLRNNLKKDTDFILTVSNDAWFGDSHGPWQHFQMARMRALELGKPVIRATNTGVTAFIDAQGKIIKQAPQFEQTVLTQRISSTQGKTPYSVLGNRPLYLLSFLLISMRMMMQFIRARILANHRK